MMKYVVVDFEMNPLPKKMKQVREICQQEIIEIGAVMLDDDWQEIDAYKSLVKPEYNPQIAPYFANLTGITTDMLAGADTFKTAFEKFAGWCAGCQDAFTVIAWSESDYQQFSSELQLKEPEAEPKLECLMGDWYDFQKEFSDIVKEKKQVSLDMALLYAKIPFTGRRHDALWDAKNTADLYRMTRSEEKRNRIAENAKTMFVSEPLTSSLGDLFNFASLVLPA
ncbi:MAG TPA: exonuclease domain-containing protein [Candidatus Eubacterium avistercoris]|uniref:Exonuclease domain-containing protein n=1 Tax=Candidatus Eubacterium avistercoris TaxID=2838567 RepID=A0A9D2D0P2_9FIRM|nr:exonuclease domain-containing protein [Candidatus Eubacterium avistercoris]